MRYNNRVSRPAERDKRLFMEVAVAGKSEEEIEASDFDSHTREEVPTGQIFEKHVFVCTGGDWCAEIDGDGLGIHARMKKAVKSAGLTGSVRVNHAGCLDQCGFGPMIVVYPDNVWYWGVQPNDVEEIVCEHLTNGRPVERLIYRNTPGKNKLKRDDSRRAIGRPPRLQTD